MIDLDALTAICPLDGRYKSKVIQLSSYFSEFGYFKYRCKIEIEYFIELCNILPQLSDFPKDRFKDLRKIYEDLTLSSTHRIKEIEQITNHDVKATEYYLKEEYDKLNLPKKCKEFIHFGLTSQDINNTAVPLAVKDALNNCLIPEFKKVRDIINNNAISWDEIPMLARTHGQPATPTRLGKEFMVYVERIDNELEILYSLKHRAKFGGASGGLNAHVVAYGDIDWIGFANRFLNRLGVKRQQYTTQIEHYDGFGALCHSISRLNTILLDFCKDIWQYISMNYFHQELNKDEIGSSAMPHKVNPIDFENAEGNFGFANAVYGFLASKLPISRLQRDLTDSTILRTIGIPMGHTLLGLTSLTRGLGKIKVNVITLYNDLDLNWVVISEAIQTVLRREAYNMPYEKLKELTRTGEPITKETIQKFIFTLKVSPSIRNELQKITPHTFTGVPL